MPWPFFVEFAESEPRLLRCRRLDRGEASAASAVGELHAPGDLGKKRVVGANAHICARLDACAALPHDDRAARYQLAGKGLYAEPLRV